MPRGHNKKTSGHYTQSEAFKTAVIVDSENISPLLCQTSDLSFTKQAQSWLNWGLNAKISS